MKTKKLVTKYLLGLTIPQQYVCLSLEEFSSPFNIFLTDKAESAPLLINPVFVGYKPVVFAMIDNLNALNANEYCLTFDHNPALGLNSNWRDFSASRNSVARMVISVLPLKFKFSPTLKLMRGEFGEHYFISAVHQKINSFMERFAKQKPGNVDLPGNLHDMVRIAYAVPRVVALVSVSENSKMNLFPTDLHGQLNDRFYISSLRIGGAAQRQVESIGKIVLSEVTSEIFDQAYSLGKNHMKDLVQLQSFQLEKNASEVFGFPLPQGVLRYFELTVLESLDVGIHRIFLYRIENIIRVRPGKTLAHIHQYYAEWRKRNGMMTELLLR